MKLGKIKVAGVPINDLYHEGRPSDITMTTVLFEKLGDRHEHQHHPSPFPKKLKKNFPLHKKLPRASPNTLEERDISRSTSKRTLKTGIHYNNDIARERE